MKEKDTFILDIKRLGINGEGIGFYNRMAVFVPNAIPGEGHSVRVEEVHEKMALAKSLEIKNPSCDRRNPSCPYYGVCGGCSTEHIAYEKMLDYKKETLLEALRRYTTINYRKFEIGKTVPSDAIYGYRNRSQLAIRKQPDGKLHAVMLQPNSNIGIDIDHCLVEHPKINEVRKIIFQYVEELGISCYMPKYGRGILRYLVVRVNMAQEVMVCLVCAEKNNKIKELAEKIISIDGVVSVYENFNFSKKDRDFFGEEMHLLEGKPYLTETLGRLQYRIYPTTFFQLNTSQAQKMYDIVKKFCKLSKKETVLDLYCGIGSIALYLADLAKEVIGIEYNKDSVTAAIENAQINRIENARFFQGDAVSLFPKLVKDGYSFDVLVVDPPRTGLGEDLIRLLIDSKIKRIVYVSCNPATLAKDLNQLTTTYKINHMIPLDMFPQTAHVESIVLLSYKNNYINIKYDFDTNKDKTCI